MALGGFGFSPLKKKLVYERVSRNRRTSMRKSERSVGSVRISDGDEDGEIVVDVAAAAVDDDRENAFRQRGFRFRLSPK